jgi:excisionase family DNA binding protein
MVTYLVRGVTVEIKLQPGEVLTVPEAAKRLGKPKMTLYRWIDANKINWVRFGGVLFIPVSEIERLKNEKAEEPTSA